MLTVLVDYDSGNLHSAEKAFQRMAQETGACQRPCQEHLARAGSSSVLQNVTHQQHRAGSAMQNHAHNFSQDRLAAVNN